MIQVLKLGFVGLRAVDIDAMRHHYSQVVGLPVSEDRGDGAVYLACGVERYALSLLPSDSAGFAHAGFHVKVEGSLVEEAGSLRDRGVEAEVVSDPLPGLDRAIRLVDPDQYELYLYEQMDTAAAPYGEIGVRPDKLGHISMLAGDVSASERFYTDNLGFRWSDWFGDFFLFMRCNADHHVVNFIASPNRGLYHLAFELRDSSELIRSVDALTNQGVAIEWGPGRHGPGHNLYTYHQDPDGNVVEFFAELDRMTSEELGYWDPRPYHTETPARPRIWSFEEENWGTPPPATFQAILGIRPSEAET